MLPNTASHGRQPLTFRDFYWWACAALLWSHMVSVYVYKTWYIAAAVVGVIAAMLVLGGSLRTTGLVRKSLPLVAYFAYLPTTHFWAARPDLALSWSAVDSIELAIFGLFYLLALNCTLRRVNDFMIALMLPALAATSVLWAINPNAIRMGGLATPLIACLLPFCLIRVKFSPKLEGLVPFIMGLGVVLISMSRAPLSAALVGITLSVFVLSDSFAQFMRFVLAFSAAAVIASVILLSFETTRVLVARSIVRAIDQPIVVGDVVIQAEGEDIVRAAIYEDGNYLLRNAMPWGIGYMNFLVYFEAWHRFPMPLHNVYQAIAVELGLPGLVLGTGLLVTYFVGLRKCLLQAKTAEERTIYKGFLIAMACVMVIAVYHQTHQSPVFYILYAFVAGLVQRQSLANRVHLASRDVSGIPLRRAGWSGRQVVASRAA